MRYLKRHDTEGALRSVVAGVGLRLEVVNMSVLRHYSPNTNECALKNSAWKMIQVRLFLGETCLFFGMYLELQEPIDGFLSKRKGLNKNNKVAFPLMIEFLTLTHPNVQLCAGFKFQCQTFYWGIISHTVDGQNPSPPRMIIIPLFIGFNHSRWCRISSINSITTCFAFDMT